MRDPNKTEEAYPFDTNDLGMELLAGSGFETEQAEPDFDNAAAGRKS